MRTNLPVSQREFPFPAGQNLVSTTDLKGRILHCNAAFVAVSGYEREELLGQPHNLIRHPDMPEEAFRDLWATVQAGRPWSGVVKNRRKDGDHYWVLANVTPLLTAGRVDGYLSVRSEASRAQIDAAEALYARMREEARQGQLTLRLSGGELLPTGMAGLLQRSRRALPWLSYWPGYMLIGAASLAAGAVHAYWGLAITAGLGAVVAALAQRRRRAALEPVVDYANRLAAGDLTSTLNSVSPHGAAASLATALRQLAVNMRALVSDTRSELRRMSAVSHDIAQGNADLAQRTQTQAANLEETAASMEEITSTVKLSADAATQASSVAGDLNQVSRRSAEVVHTVTGTMGAIASSSRRISDIIQLIESIAFQTNILALNAAVESARAGEHGRGFAVVASEVRALAQRSANAAKEIKQLIGESSTQVENGERQTLAARQSIDETLTSVASFRQLIEGIDNAAREQLEGISQIYTAVQQIEGITQQNAALVERLAEAGEQLRERTGEVNAALALFKLEANAGHTATDAVELRRQYKQAA